MWRLLDKDKKYFNLAEYRKHSYRRLSIVIILVLLPFIFNALMNHDVIVTLAGGAVALILLVNVISLYKHDAYLLHPAVTTLAMIPGILAVVYAKQVIGVLWSYPVLGMLFFIHDRKTALVFSGIVIASMAPLTFDVMDFSISSRVIVTQAITVAFANIFLHLIEQQQEHLSRMVITDALTGVYNRRYFDDRISHAHGMCNRGSQETLLMLDIDNFKLINDEFGHKAGDGVLVDFTRLIKHRIRETDYLFRIGGEEFAILLENSSLDMSKKLAEDIRTSIAEHYFIDHKVVTCSIGIAELQKNESTDSWLRRADATLYEAKRNGRNRVEVSS